MKILFSPAGDTDPVRGFYDGGMLHIIRHHGPMDKVIIFLTKDMEMKEEETNCYTAGICSVNPDCDIEFIKSGITDPHQFEPLTALQDAYVNARKRYPETEWYFNLSSGTPQIKAVMALLALDYPDAKAIQVSTPENKSNRGNGPWKTKEDLEQMLALNEDHDSFKPDRCSISDLALLKKHSLKLQIKSLVQNYEYEGALRLIRQNQALFSEIAEKLLCHAVYRENLMWREANKIISRYRDTPLISKAGDFEEFFRVMELRQKKKQLPEFIMKISPVLKELGETYLDKIKELDISRCGYQSTKGFRIDREKMNAFDPHMIQFLESELETTLKSGPLYFNIITYICQYYSENSEKNNEEHQEITKAFLQLRKVEEKVRNLVAHEITNIDEIKIQKFTQGNMDKGLTSAQILHLLHRITKLIRGEDVYWDYGQLNEKIIDSL